MTKSELNKRWAELEGWEFKENQCYCPDTTLGGKPLPVLIPDFTEPNRFFAEVVPRMREFNCFPKLYVMVDVGWRCVFISKFISQFISPLLEGIGVNVGEAGLEAAIKTREALNES